MSEQPKRLVIENKASGPRWEKKFFEEIQAAVINGYRLADNSHSADVSMRNYMGFMGRAVLYVPGFEPLKGEPKGFAREVSSLEEAPERPPEAVADKPLVLAPEEAKNPSEDAAESAEGIPEPEAPEAPIEGLEMLTKKKELLAYAKESGVTVPSDMNVPSQIKKFIKDTQTK